MPYTNNVKLGARCRLRCTLSHLLNGVLAGNGILPSMKHNLIYLKASYWFTYFCCSCSEGKKKKSHFNCKKDLSFLLLNSTVSFASDYVLWQHLEKKHFLALNRKIFPSSFSIISPYLNVAYEMLSKLSYNVTVGKNVFSLT